MRVSEIEISSKYPWSTVYQEIKEVLQSKSFKELKEELLDVYTTFCICVYKNIGIDMLVIPNSSLSKYMKRIHIWKTVIESYDYTFNPDSLSEGSNYNRPEKVRKVMNYYGI